VVTPTVNAEYAAQYVTAGQFPVYTAQNQPRPAFTTRIDGFAPGQRYHLLLRARDAAGNETSENEISTTDLTEVNF